MATWGQIKALTQRIPGVKIVNERESVLVVEVSFDDGRSHRAFISEHISGVGSTWVVISVFIAESSPQRLERVARVASNYFCGGVATFTFDGTTMIVLREGFPTQNLDPMELVRPLAVLSSTADYLEAALTGGRDNF